MPLPGLSADFNEPQSNDPTTAPPMQQPQQPAPPQGLAQALARRKKKGLVTSNHLAHLRRRSPKAKRARPSSHKNG